MSGRRHLYWGVIGNKMGGGVEFAPLPLGHIDHNRHTHVQQSSVQ